MLQIKLTTGGHIWVVVDITEQTADGTICVLKHGPQSIEYGLRLAEAVLQAEAVRVPINAQMTTLAATCLALEQQLSALTGGQEQAEAHA
ncbi:hypothetical protein [Kordiimonas marina]|uniref:hypothetical protein n=1 Tax=Kordiimonas marina TaxID=2872312 RepID=UPI001FF4674A|nr:hypothetical protein [Kordiimonas marina]MCJ9428573.1 hypothetical protein [Kordiimonas marina]